MLAVGGVDSGQPEDVAAGLDTGLDQTAAAKWLEANPKDLVGGAQVVRQAIETGRVGPAIRQKPVSPSKTSNGPS